MIIFTGIMRRGARSLLERGEGDLTSDGRWG